MDSTATREGEKDSSGAPHTFRSRLKWQKAHFLFNTKVVPCNPLRNLLPTIRVSCTSTRTMMPIVSALERDPNMYPWWVVSRGGCWHYGSGGEQKKSGRGFRELARDGFFNVASPDEERWIQSSKPHSGEGPDQVWLAQESVNLLAIPSASMEWRISTCRQDVAHR